MLEKCYQILSDRIDLYIPPGAVYNKTKFIVKLTNKDFDCPNGVYKLSPVFELQPHSKIFNAPVIIRFKNIKSK